MRIAIFKNRIYLIVQDDSGENITVSSNDYTVTMYTVGSGTVTEYAVPFMSPEKTITLQYQRNSDKYKVEIKVIRIYE